MSAMVFRERFIFFPASWSVRRKRPEWFARKSPLMANANSPSYLIVGRGRWGARMHAMLTGEGRRAEFASGLRRQSNESSSAHESRLTQIFSDSSAQIV